MITGQLAFSYLSKIVIVILNFFLFVTLTRFLTKGEYGLVSLFFVTIALLSRYLNLGLTEYVVKEFAGLKEKLRRAKFSHIFSFSGIVSIIFLVVMLPLLSPLLRFFGLQTYFIPALLVLFIIDPAYACLVHGLPKFGYGFVKRHSSTLIGFDNYWHLNF